LSRDPKKAFKNNKAKEREKGKGKKEVVGALESKATLLVGN